MVAVKGPRRTGPKREKREMGGKAGGNWSAWRPDMVPEIRVNNESGTLPSADKREISWFLFALPVPFSLLLVTEKEQEEREESNQVARRGKLPDLMRSAGLSRQSVSIAISEN